MRWATATAAFFIPALAAMRRSEQLAEQPPQVIAVTAFQRQLKFRAPMPDAARGISSQISHCGLAGGDGVQDRPAALTGNVAQHRTELDVGCLQQPDDAVDDAVSLALQMSARRVSSRNSRTGCGGTKLPLSNPSCR